MKSHHPDEEAVLLALHAFSQRATAILDRIAGRESVAALEQLNLRALYSTLKEDLRDAATRGRISSIPSLQTPWERSYFAPAVHRSCKALRARVNTNPITSNWTDCLVEANEVLVYYLNMLMQDSRNLGPAMPALTG